MAVTLADLIPIIPEELREGFIACANPCEEAETRAKCCTDFDDLYIDRQGKRKHTPNNSSNFNFSHESNSRKQ